MAAHTATDWTVVINPTSTGGAGPRSSPEGKRHRNLCQISVSTAADYPDGGIPIPSAGAMGLVRNVEFISIIDGDYDNSLIPKFGASGQVITLHLATASGQVATTALAPLSLFVEAVGW